MSLQTDNIRWDLETDLLVVGAGAAGMTAALVGAIEGLRTVLCEKSDSVGGTTATSAGTVWVPGSRQSKAAGIPDSLDAAKAYLAAILGDDHANDERLASYLATGPVVLDYLERRTSVRFVPPPIHPDYQARPGEIVSQLARAIGVDGAVLAETIDRHNRYAETGVDEDLGRGASELNRFNGDSMNQLNPCMRPIALVQEP